MAKMYKFKPTTYISVNNGELLKLSFSIEEGSDIVFINIDNYAIVPIPKREWSHLTSILLTDLPQLSCECVTPNFIYGFSDDKIHFISYYDGEETLILEFNKLVDDFERFSLIINNMFIIANGKTSEGDYILERNVIVDIVTQQSTSVSVESQMAQLFPNTEVSYIMDVDLTNQLLLTHSNAMSTGYYLDEITMPDELADRFIVSYNEQILLKS